MSVVVIFAEAKQARERRHNEQIGSGTYEGGAAEEAVSNGSAPGVAAVRAWW